MVCFKNRKMPRHLLFLSLCVVLSGCATSAGKSGDAAFNVSTANEALLKAAENYSGLIDIYRERLDEATSVEESDYYRLKLGQVYLDSGDLESALFYINPIIEEGRGSADVFLLKSRTFLMMGDRDKALAAVMTAHGFDTEDPHIYNQLGLIQADTGLYEDARRNFNKARRGRISDVTIQNNLAMLDILEGQYDSAVQRLMPLQQTGQANRRINSNLALALAKSGRYGQFVSLYGQGLSEDARITLFKALAKAETVQ